MAELDIIVPCYNENESVNLLFNELSLSLNDFIDWNIIFIDDGSKDKTLENIKKIAQNNDNVKYISFSRNFGKESAMFAGLEHSTAEYVIIMDADLQDPPEIIPKMFSYVDDYDIVATRRVSRKGEPVIRSFFARRFYKLMNKITSLDIVDGARDYRLMKRYVVDSILELKEYNRFSKGIFQWVGFKTKWIEYENVERIEGETSWSFWGLLVYSLEGIISFTTVPLHISTVFGIIFSILAFIFIVVIVIRTLLYGDSVEGWPSTISIILFIGGIQLFSLGILGQYLAKTYMEVKDRPIYLIKEEKT